LHDLFRFFDPGIPGKGESAKATCKTKKIFFMRLVLNFVPKLTIPEQISPFSEETKSAGGSYAVKSKMHYIYPNPNRMR